MQVNQDGLFESKIGEQTKILILITTAPFSSQEPYRAYQLVSFLKKNGVNPIVFHMMDGIYNLSNLPSYILNFQNNINIIRELIELGIRIIACSRCLIARGFWDENHSDIDERSIVPSNTIENIEVKGIQQLLEFIGEGYKVLKF